MDWKAYKQEAAALFESLGCKATVGRSREGRWGEHRVDVWLESERLGINTQWMLDCRHWNTVVTKAEVIALKKRLKDLGGDRAIMLSNEGFDSGATQAARDSQITLTSLAALGQAAEAEIVNTSLLSLENRISQTKRALENLVQSQLVGPGIWKALPLPGVDGAQVAAASEQLEALRLGFGRARLRQPPYVLSLSPARSSGQLEDFAAQAIARIEQAEALVQRQRQAARARQAQATPIPSPDPASGLATAVDQPASTRLGPRSPDQTSQNQTNQNQTRQNQTREAAAQADRLPARHKKPHFTLARRQRPAAPTAPPRTKRSGPGSLRPANGAGRSPRDAASPSKADQGSRRNRVDRPSTKAPGLRRSSPRPHSAPRPLLRTGESSPGSRQAPGRRGQPQRSAPSRQFGPVNGPVVKGTVKGTVKGAARRVSGGDRRRQVPKHRPLQSRRLAKPRLASSGDRAVSFPRNRTKPSDRRLPSGSAPRPRPSASHRPRPAIKSRGVARPTQLGRLRPMPQRRSFSAGPSQLPHSDSPRQPGPEAGL